MLLAVAKKLMPVRAIVLTAIVLTLGASAQPAVAQADEGKIVFASRSGIWGNIYVMNSDGSGRTRLTDSHGYQPRWSPDGKRIAFTSYRNESHNIWVMNADGSVLTQLTDDSLGVYKPNWSPDGQQIAFYDSQKWRLHLMNADGSDVIRLTNSQAGQYITAWSPDSQRIAFSTMVSGGSQIYTIRTDGTDLTKLTSIDPSDNDGESDQEPVWSPSGHLIAFTSLGRGGVTHGIYVMNADGSGLTRLSAYPKN